VVTIVGSRRDADGNSTSFYDTNTSETLLQLRPMLFEDDFVGAGHTAGVPAAGSPVAGYPWVKKIVGAGPPTVAIQANTGLGVMACSLTSTSEKEDAALYSADQLVWDATKGLIFEARVAFGTVPGSGVESVFGIQSAWIDGPDNASYYAQFQASASGAINMRTKDGVNTLSFATGVTLVANAYHLFRIDMSDVTNVIFQIDGVNVSRPGQMSFAATGSNALLQPYLSIYKASGAGTGSLLIDMVQLASNRS
jgi:hypothetical protein